MTSTGLNDCKTQQGTPSTLQHHFAAAKSLCAEADRRKAALWELFQEFDRDSDGKIQLFQLGSARQSLGRTSGEWGAEQVDELQQQIVTGKIASFSSSGAQISGRSFVRHFRKTLHDLNDEQFDLIIGQFRELARSCNDAPKKGSMNSQGSSSRNHPNEHSSPLQLEARAVFDSIDSNGDGVIDREEFATALDRRLHL